MTESAQPTTGLHLDGLGEIAPSGQPRQMPLGASVAEWLGDEIVFGRIPPGARLTTVDICRQLKVSQTPVREAFRLLNGEGLVRLEGHRGAWVAEIEPNEVEDIYECRAYLQGLAARQSAERATDEDLEQIQQALEQMHASTANDDRVLYFRSNLELHRLIARSARNRTLAELNDRLGRRTLQLRYMSINLPGRLEESVKRHSEIVEAIIGRRGELAEQITRDTIRRSAIAICEAYAR